MNIEGEFYRAIQQEKVLDLALCLLGGCWRAADAAIEMN